MNVKGPFKDKTKAAAGASKSWYLSCFAPKLNPDGTIALDAEKRPILQRHRSYYANYGFRADVSNGYVREGQLSPRINFVYTPTESTNFHAGYARYFTPPLELVSNEAIAKFANTTNTPEVTTSSPVRSERSHYIDLGVTHNFTKAWSVGIDGYYTIYY